MEVRFTRKDYDLLPEDLRVELIDGQLLKMAPPSVNHQQVLRRALFALAGSLGESRVMPGPVGFAIDQHHALIPDLVVLREDQQVGGEDRDLSTALVVVEVLSPSTRRRDREVKTELYFDNGVDEVWLIDYANLRAETFGVEGWTTFEPGSILTSRVLPGFELPLSALFG